MQVPEGCVPLVMHMEACATQDEMNGNVMATIRRGYTRINEYIGSFTGRVHIVGSGPSIKHTWKDIDSDVLAINSAIGFMIDHGIPPRLAMIWDASPLCQAFAVPSEHTTYLIGARCHESVFDRLKGQRVICWHAGGDHNIADFLREHKIDEPLINGGSAGVTRALYLAYALGYRDIHVHGADSSYSDAGDTHIRGSLVQEKDMKVFVGGKWFRTTPEYCAQVEEFKSIWTLFHHMGYGARVTVHGTGLLPYVASLLRQSDGMVTQQSQPLEELAA